MKEVIKITMYGDKVLAQCYLSKEIFEKVERLRSKTSRSAFREEIITKSLQTENLKNNS